MILRMYWLTKYQPIIDSKQKTLVLVIPEGESLVYTGSCPSHTIPLISTAKAHKLVGKGCITYLCAIEVAEIPKLEPKDIPIVREFPKVFQEVPGFPLDWKTDFAIELVPSTALISKAP